MSSVWPDCSDDACNKSGDEEKAKSEVKGEDLHAAYVSSLDQLLFDGKYSHLFLASSDALMSRRRIIRRNQDLWLVIMLNMCVERDLTPARMTFPPFSLRRSGPVFVLARR